MVRSVPRRPVLRIVPNRTAAFGVDRELGVPAISRQCPTAAFSPLSVFAWPSPALGRAHITPIPRQSEPRTVHSFSAAFAPFLDWSCSEDIRYRLGILLFCTGASAFIFGDKVERAIQAPFDSFVCFETSLANCAKRALGGNYAHLIDGPGSPFSWKDESGGKVSTSTDGAVSCSLGGAVKTPKVDVNLVRDVVYFSPVTLLQAKEAIEQLEIRRAGCARAINIYESQSKFLALQDRQSRSQSAVAYFSSLTENKNLGATKIDYGPVAAGDLARFGMTNHTNIVEALLAARKDGVLTAEAVRDSMKAQAMGPEVKTQITDLQRTISLQVGDVEKLMFPLNLAVGDIAKPKKQLVPNGEWVLRGATIASVRLEER